MTTEVLREKVKKYIEAADKRSLLVIQSILEQKQDEHWWDNLPDEVKKSVRKALKDIDEGKGIPHETVKKMYPQWFKR